MKRPKVYLIPIPLSSEVDPQLHLPNETIKVIESLHVFAVENVRTFRRFLVKLDLKSKIDSSTIILFSKKNESESINEVRSALIDGSSIGVLSEAGCPGIADPGSLIAQLAHQKGFEVVPLIGPSSILLALMASGFNGQNFTFNGYLPKEASEKEKALQELERKSRMEQGSSQLFMETPFKNDQLINSCLKVLKPSTKLCIAAEITSPHAYIKSKQIGEWQKQMPPKLNKKATMFVLQA